MNEKLGYEESFGFQLIDGRPFYFFMQSGKIGISFDSQIEPVQFDEVTHYVCCSGSVYGIEGNDAMVSFFARIEGAPYYVEMGVYR